MVRQSAASRGRNLSLAVACMNVDRLLPSLSLPSGAGRRVPISRLMWPDSKTSFFIAFIIAYKTNVWMHHLTPSQRGGNNIRSRQVLRNTVIPIPKQPRSKSGENTSARNKQATSIPKQETQHHHMESDEPFAHPVVPVSGVKTKHCASSQPKNHRRGCGRRVKPLLTCSTSTNLRVGRNMFMMIIGEGSASRQERQYSAALTWFNSMPVVANPTEDDSGRLSGRK